tara:strand:+ start:528 stop:725 length:198 start_codon:yes stop_codon:yes gene_type:complete
MSYEDNLDRADKAVEKLTKQLIKLMSQGTGSDPKDVIIELQDMIHEAIDRVIDSRTQTHTINTIR